MIYSKTARYFLRILLLSFLFSQLACSSGAVDQTVKSVMDGVVTRFYASMDEKELENLTYDQVMSRLTDAEKSVLATRYWVFDVNVPVVVSVMHNEDHLEVPFWLEEGGFIKTDMVVKNEEYVYDVWQKQFPAGQVELGISGFDGQRAVYFTAVGSLDRGEHLQIKPIFPEKQHFEVMDVGAFIYHDWDELVVTELPESLKGQQLLTTIRGRARESHLIRAFRKTPFPSSDTPDQVLLTWGDDPRTTQSIQWRTNTQVKKGAVRIWTNDEKAALLVNAGVKVLEDRLLQNDRYIHRHTAVLTGLQPGTVYHYQVGGFETDQWSEPSEFKTAPGGDEPFQFVYFGDTHRSPHWGEMINAAFQRHPQTAFYTIGGDVVSTGLYRDHWDHLFAYSENVIRQRPLMTALGNHDSQDGLGVWMYRDLFDLPENGPAGFESERSYSFNYSNALFVIVDATADIDMHTPWLEQTLSESRAVWKFVIFHFPPYSHDHDYAKIRENWGAVFDRHHVDMVMSGHVHYYLRSKPIFAGKPVGSAADGTIYLISVGVPGTGDRTPEADFVEKTFGGEMLYQTFDLNGNRLVFKARALDGSVRDEFEIIK